MHARALKMLGLAMAAALIAGGAQAADPEPADAEAGAALAADCSGCHGAAGVSVEDSIPNLAAQKAPYIVEQLTAFREGERKNDLMNAIAAQLSDTDIANLAAHFGGLPGAEPGAVGEANAVFGAAELEFPADFKDSFERYHTISFDDRKQVRNYYVSKGALEAAGDGPLPDGTFILVEVHKAKADDAGAPVKGDDGHFVAGELSVYTAMQKVAGAGDAVPGLLRNGDWRYGVFDASGAQKAGLNEGRCLACHKPLDGADFLFLRDELATVAKGR